MLRLFGAPSERVFGAYEELAPLAEGWRERVELYQLLPLLVHALLFGGSYGAAAERVARPLRGAERVPPGGQRVGLGEVRATTLHSSAAAVPAGAGGDRAPLPAAADARAGGAARCRSSPRQLQRAYAQFGERTFSEELRARRMAAAAELLAAQRSIPVRDVARLVGYGQAAHFARAFRRRYGVPPARFRELARAARAEA